MLLHASLSVAAIWSLLACGLGAPVAFGLSALLLLATRTRAHTAHRVARRRPWTGPLWFGAGVCTEPGFALAALATARAIGIPTPTASAPIVPADALALLTVGPLFEELLYRERLLPALEAGGRRALALAVSTLAFALPHVDPVATLAALWVGPALGALFLRTRDVWVCVAFHAGLNAGALLTRAAGGP